MTYQQLFEMIQTLDKNQLDREVLVYNQEEDFFYDDGTSFAVSVNAVPGFIDKGFPYLVV